MQRRGLRSRYIGQRGYYPKCTGAHIAPVSPFARCVCADQSAPKHLHLRAELVAVKDKGFRILYGPSQPQQRGLLVPPGRARPESVRRLSRKGKTRCTRALIYVSTAASRLRYRPRPSYMHSRVHTPLLDNGEKWRYSRNAPHGRGIDTKSRTVFEV